VRDLIMDPRNLGSNYERPLAECMARFQDREFLFVEPTGNWGDTLIYRGAEALGKRLGLKWRRLTVGEFIALPPEPHRAVYIHGGGGFNRFCSGKALLALAHAVTHYRGPVINGPTTVDDDDGYVEQRMLPSLSRAVAAEIVIFVRERTSLAALAGRLPAGMNLCLDHDTALQLTAADALDGHTMRGRYDLCALREDNEAPVAVDSSELKGVRLDPALYARTFDHWVRLHAFARRIVTNRTHSSMLGAVLGKPTTLLGGIYHKNRSIWEYSLRPRGVQWLDWRGDVGQPPPRRNWMGRLPIAARIARSWKVRRTMNRLRGVPWS